MLRKIFTWGNVNTLVETGENFANDCVYLLSVNRFWQGSQSDVSDVYLKTVMSVSLFLSCFKFYFVRKQNLIFEEAAAPEQKVVESKPLKTPLLDDDLSDLPELEPAHVDVNVDEHKQTHDCGHGHSHGCEHAHSHGGGHEHASSKLSCPQTTLVLPNTSNHVFNYSASLINISNLCFNELLKIELLLEWKFTVVTVSSVVGFIGMWAKTRNDVRTLQGIKTSACSHAHHGEQKADAISNANAVIEAITSAANNFNDLLESYELINGGLEGVSLNFIIPSAVVSAVFGAASFFPHQDYNDAFEKGELIVASDVEQPKVNEEPREKKSSSTNRIFSVFNKTNVLSFMDGVNHLIDYSTTLTSLMAFFTKGKPNYSKKDRICLLLGSGLFGLAGTVAVVKNERKAMKSAEERNAVAKLGS